MAALSFLARCIAVSLLLSSVSAFHDHFDDYEHAQGVEIDAADVQPVLRVAASDDNGKLLEAIRLGKPIVVTGVFPENEPGPFTDWTCKAIAKDQRLAGVHAKLFEGVHSERTDVKTAVIDILKSENQTHHLASFFPIPSLVNFSAPAVFKNLSSSRDLWHKRAQIVIRTKKTSPISLKTRCQTTAFMQATGSVKWLLAPVTDEGGYFASAYKLLADQGKWTPTFSAEIGPNEALVLPPAYFAQTTASKRCSIESVLKLELPYPAKFIHDQMDTFTHVEETHNCFFDHWASFITGSGHDYEHVQKGGAKRRAKKRRMDMDMNGDGAIDTAEFKAFRASLQPPVQEDHESDINDWLVKQAAKAESISDEDLSQGEHAAFQEFHSANGGLVNGPTFERNLLDFFMTYADARNNMSAFEKIELSAAWAHTQRPESTKHTKSPRARHEPSSDKEEVYEEPGHDVPGYEDVEAMDPAVFEASGEAASPLLGSDEPVQHGPGDSPLEMDSHSQQQGVEHGVPSALEDAFDLQQVELLQQELDRNAPGGRKAGSIEKQLQEISIDPTDDPLLSSVPADHEMGADLDPFGSQLPHDIPMDEEYDPVLHGRNADDEPAVVDGPAAQRHPMGDRSLMEELSQEASKKPKENKAIDALRDLLFMSDFDLGLKDSHDEL